MAVEKIIFRSRPNMKSKHFASSNAHEPIWNVRAAALEQQSNLALPWYHKGYAIVLLHCIPTCLIFPMMSSAQRSLRWREDAPHPPLCSPNIRIENVFCAGRRTKRREGRSTEGQKAHVLVDCFPLTFNPNPSLDPEPKPAPRGQPKTHFHAPRFRLRVKGGLRVKTEASVGLEGAGEARVPEIAFLAVCDPPTAHFLAGAWP